MKWIKSISRLLVDERGLVGLDINAADDTVQVSGFLSRYNEYLDKAETAIDADDIEGATAFMEQADAVEREWDASLTGTSLPADVKAPTVKPRGLSQSVENEALEKELIAARGDLGELPTYTVRSSKEAAKRVIELLDSDYDRAQRIIDGEESAPEGLYPEDVFTGMRIRAVVNGDTDTLIALVSSPIVSGATTLGQRIQALDAGADITDPFKVIKELVDARQEQAKKNPDAVLQAAEIERLKTELEVTKAALDAKYAEAAIKKMRKEAPQVARPVDRAARHTVLVAEREVLNRRLAVKFGRISANPMLDPETVAIMLSMVRNRLEAGVFKAALSGRSIPAGED